MNKPIITISERLIDLELLVDRLVERIEQGDHKAINSIAHSLQRTIKEACKDYGTIYGKWK